MTLLGAEQALVSGWVLSQLEAKTTELEEVSEGLTERIFEDFAPEGTAYPFVIYQCQSPPRDVRGVGVTRIMVDTLYIVKAVAQVSSYAPLAGAAVVIDAAMTSAAGSAVTDGWVFASVRQEQFAMVEIESGKQYRHFGGIFQIQAQA